jgi:outer membrane protein assembly factor BamE (lipoprotein component of BamABCDE complex)
MTLGTVQREIRVGMSGAEVAAALGSPNIVTTDEQRRETWVYDRMATERVYSNSGGGFTLLLAGASGRSGAAQSTQRTLTVVIKFDNVSRVRDFSYRSSSF